MSLLFFGQASLIVLVFPGLLVYWAVRRRSWKLGVLPALYIGLLCWGIYLFVANSPEGPPNEWIWFFGSHSYSRPLATLLPVVFALVGLPNVVPWMLLIAWLRRRRWQRIGLLLAASIAAAAAIAVPFLRYDGQQMDPWEYYSWPGWLALWFLGAYATGALILAWVVLKTLYRWLRRGVHNVRRRASC
jgi:hypothetical protein